jgi:hypothetical protein
MTAPFSSRASAAISARCGCITDTRAAEATRAVNARAFTAGKYVVFGVEQYVPETVQGKSLLAHELTHVVQQDNTPPTTEEDEEKIFLSKKKEDYNSKVTSNLESCIQSIKGGEQLLIQKPGT